MNIFFLIYAAVDSVILSLVIQHTNISSFIIGNFTPQIEILITLILAMCWVLSIFIVSIIIRSNLNRLINYLRALGFAGVLYGIGLIALITHSEYTEIGLRQALLIYVSTFFLFLTSRMGFLIMYKIIYFLLARQKSIIIIGSTETALKLIQYFNESRYFRNFLGIFDDEAYIKIELAKYHLGNREQVKGYCLNNGVDEIYYTLPNHDSYLNDLRQFADKQYIYLGIVPEIDNNDDFKMKTNFIDHWGIPVISYERSPLSYKINHFAKRTLDIVVSSIILSFFGITLFPVIAILIRLTSKGPVIFKQLRHGKNCKTFWCYKFRTMIVNNEADIKQASENDKRITKIGKFLRRTNLDEFPQFYNVLKGDMSVVGPRPHMLLHTDQYATVISNYKIRHMVDAGITGYAQVNGLRGVTRELSQMEQRIFYDKWYLEHWSLLLDLKIIFLTVIKMLGGQKTAY
jgi:putative colanic acid biosynthesis UDP-glucose lipid carrier transferase